ncbi:hypothetical protein J6590_057573 [Homalodisca vitripennis]|nr:hypothetical protein J6590_057573 [Homalodisca vitripennis]
MRPPQNVVYFRYYHVYRALKLAVITLVLSPLLMNTIPLFSRPIRAIEVSSNHSGPLKSAAIILILSPLFMNTIPLFSRPVRAIESAAITLVLSPLPLNTIPLFSRPIRAIEFPYFLALSGPLQSAAINLVLSPLPLNTIPLFSRSVRAIAVSSNHSGTSSTTHEHNSLIFSPCQGH